MRRDLARYLAIALLGVAAPAAWSQDEVPNNAIGIGWYFIFYKVYASPLTGPLTPAGLGLDVNDTNTPYFAYFRRLSPHFQFELATGVPPLTKSVGKGPATLGSVPYNGQVLTTARWLAPSALLEYKFRDEDKRIRPFIGAGVNFVSFYDRNSTAAGNEAAGGPTRIELSNSLSAAGTVGVNVGISHNFSAQLSYSAARTHTRLYAITDDVVRTSSIDFNPSSIVVSALYGF
jgi:outer membrane protein